MKRTSLNDFAKLSLRCGAGLSALLIASAAFAQDAPADDEEAPKDEIVVTGTLVRGIAPAGANVIGVEPAQIKATGATTTSELLRTIPQMSDFGQLGGALPFGDRITINRPNLRGLPGASTSGGSTTLLLVNGHRIAGMGIVSTTPDQDIVPPGALQRLEIVADGGSAIYGSDAVGGVLNFITRKDFDGAEVKARYGFADDYHTVDADVTIGRKWDGGSIFASYNYSYNDSILGRDRDYVFQPAIASGFAAPGPQTRVTLQCTPGNVQIGSSVYALPYTTATAAASANRANQCDNSDYAVMYPTARRHALMAGINQQLSDSFAFDMQAFYMNKKTSFYGGGGGTLSTTSTVSSANPFFAAHRVGVETQHTLYFEIPGQYGPFGQEIELAAWGVTPTFTLDLGGSWQARLLNSYSESTTNSQSKGVSTDAINNALASTNAAVAFNPYDPGSTNPATLAAVTQWGAYGRARQSLWESKLVIDGDLFTMPGGAVKLAVGAEYIKEGYNVQRGDTIIGSQNGGSPGISVNGVLIAPAVAGLPIRDLHRNVKSAFGELVVPLFSDENGFTGMKELTVSLSGRIDDYSDVGSTTNPKVGVTWKPFDALRIRGSWGTSFNAPSLADSAGAQPFSGGYVPILFAPFLSPPASARASGVPAPALIIGSEWQAILVMQGNDPNIKPQSANTWSAGADLEPVPGLKLSATYWHVGFEGQIDIPPITVPELMFNSYRHLWTFNPTQAQINAAIATTQGGSVPGSPCFLPAFLYPPGVSCTYAILNFFKTNLGDFRMNGLDFSADYRSDTSFGSVDFSVNGTYELKREQRSSATTAWINQFKSSPGSRFRLSASVGADFGNLRTQATVYHRAGYTLAAPVGLSNQAKVDSFTFVDLFFRYSVPGDGAFKDLAFSLGVKNVFDQDPPFYDGQNSIAGGQGITNGNTVGRFFQFGIEKKF